MIRTTSVIQSTKNSRVDYVALLQLEFAVKKPRQSNIPATVETYLQTRNIYATQGKYYNCRWRFSFLRSLVCSKKNCRGSSLWVLVKLRPYVVHFAAILVTCAIWGHNCSQLPDGQGSVSSALCIWENHALVSSVAQLWCGRADMPEGRWDQVST